MKFNYKGRIVEAASRDEAVRKIAAAGESDYKGATKAVKRCIALKRALKKIKKGTQLTSLTIGDSWDDVWTDDLKVSSLEDFLDDNGNLYVVPYMTDMTVPDHADLTEDDVKALDALLGAHGGDNAYKECLKKKPDGTYSFGSMGWVQVDVIDWFPELVVPFEDSSVKKVTEYANQVNAKFAEVQQKLDAIFGKQGKATRKAESRSTYRNPIKDRDGGQDPDFKGVMRDISAEGLAKKVKELKDYVDGLFLGATDGVVYDIAIGGSVGPVDDSTCRKIAEDLIDSRKNGMYGFDVIYAWVRASKILPDGDTEASYGGLVHKYLRHSPSGTRAEIDDDIYEDSDIGVHDLYPEAPDLDVLIAKGMEGAKEAYRKYADAIIAQVENDRIPELREAFKKAKQEHEGILAHERKLADDSDKYQARLKRGKYEGQGDPLQNPGRFEERRLENTKKAAVDILNGLRKDTELTFSRTDMGDDTIAGHLTLQQVEENLDGNLLYVGPTHMDISVSPEARLPAPSKDAILHIGYYDDDDYTTENEDGTFTFYEGNYRAYIGPYTSSLEVDLSKPDAVNKLRAYVSSVNKELESFQRKADAIVRSAQKYTRDVANNPRP